jgi:hypothetical protein
MRVCMLVATCMNHFWECMSNDYLDLCGVALSVFYATMCDIVVYHLCRDLLIDRQYFWLQ